MAVALTLGLFLAAWSGAWLWALFDCFKRDRGAFVATGRSKALWLGSIALVGPFAGLGYVLLVRPSLRRVERLPHPASAPSPDREPDMDAWLAFVADDDREPRTFDAS